MSAISAELLNKQHFEFTLRTQASYIDEITAMVEIAKTLKWNLVSILYEDSDYGYKVKRNSYFY